MMFPMDLSIVVTGLVCGVVFGFALERAGFASACKLTAQLRFQDWAVFNVMFTAIVVCAIGLYLFKILGLLSMEDVYVPTTYLWATLLGGVGVGAGMSIGGYCPGTSVVGFMSGKVDGFVFFLGIIAGTWVFAGVYDWLEPMLEALPRPDAETLPELFGVPEWVILIALTAVAAIGGWITTKPKPAN
ncbi:MAG: YeeE/YedE family protein [Aquimonas sp.]|jgi:uncharacterized protein|nr:YeeE/YedE family protein [Xanthomonadales bacterium]MCC6506934.1 YeeE/YedE family protein [Aquimonas sp.]